MVVISLLTATITGLVFHVKRVQENEKFQNIVDESVTLTISYDRILSDKEYDEFRLMPTYQTYLTDTTRQLS